MKDCKCDHNETCPICRNRKEIDRMWPEKECPQCACFRAKLNREKMAKVAYEHMFPDRYGWEKETDEHLLSNYRNLADHYIKYLTE